MIVKNLFVPKIVLPEKKLTRFCLWLSPLVPVPWTHCRGNSFLSASLLSVQTSHSWSRSTLGLLTFWNPTRSPIPGDFPQGHLLWALRLLIVYFHTDASLYLRCARHGPLLEHQPLKGPLFLHSVTQFKILPKGSCSKNLPNGWNSWTPPSFLWGRDVCRYLGRTDILPILQGERTLRVK